MCTTFQVERGDQFLRLDDLQSVLHQHDCYGLHPRFFQCEHAVDLGEHGKRIVLEICDVLWQYSFQSFELSLLHRFYDKLMVVAEEEETSAFARTLACVEYLLAIERRAQTHLQYVKGDIVGI